MGKLAAAAPLLQHHLILQGRSITLVGKCGLARCDFLGILWPKIASLFFFVGWGGGVLWCSEDSSDEPPTGVCSESNLGVVIRSKERDLDANSIAIGCYCLMQTTLNLDDIVASSWTCSTLGLFLINPHLLPPPNLVSSCTQSSIHCRRFRG